ncbi:MAG: pyridoxal phosphate-dependent aminotransferase [Acidobacteriota bacterium]|nr:pyridoxal phosphate-dependent aminotransferase [Acidobacteriota bacterium]
MEQSHLISQFARSVEASPTMAMNALAKEIAAEGKDVLSFAVGEPDFPTPAHICEAAKRAIDAGDTKYTLASGTVPLRKAICDATERDLGLSYSPAQVVVGNGGKHALMNVWRTLLDPGDEVIVFAPYWVSYVPQVEMAGGTPVVVETYGDDDFQPDLDRVRAAVTPRTKAILVNSPSNPTGGVLTRESLEGIAEVACASDLIVISDEIYKHILFDGRSHVSPAQLDGMKDRTILVDGVAKTYAMTGWRIGWLIAPEQFARKAGDIQSQETSNPCSISQAATVEALNGPQDTVAVMRAAFEERRNYIVPALNAIPGIKCPNPGGAFYVFPDITGIFGRTVKGEVINNSNDFCMALLRHGLVSTVPGSASGLEGYFRISFACSMEQIKAGVERIGELLA